jgi:DNA invertase Pin-like site-specific DNA recombinase
MLTVAYCRVSTEEQTAEGFSIAGQADKLRVYAELHDLGEVTVIADPGLSGKNLERPGLQQLLHMVNEGHVPNVLTWRLDRLSRNLSDLILLADQFGQCGVALHSFTEKIDLSSATGRMFYNILGSFAQFSREQLAENVRMGMHQAVRQGKWINRPKTGFDLIEGELVPNEMAPVVRRIFAMRNEGASQSQIADATGVKYSTVLGILHSRIYLGEVQLNGEWFSGHHEPLITPEIFTAAHRGRIKGQNKGKDLLYGRVRCGMCGRLMAIDQNGEGRKMYRCHHRGKGCKQPRRTNEGSSGPPSSDCGSSAPTSNSRRPYVRSSSGPVSRPLPAEGPLAPHCTQWTSWRGNGGSCCACTTTTGSEPTCSPRRRLAWPWP